MKETLTTVKLPKELKKQAQIAAINAGLSFKDYLIEALTEKIISALPDEIKDTLSGPLFNKKLADAIKK